MSEYGFVYSERAYKVTDLRWQREPKTQIFAENRRYLQIHPFFWKFQHLEDAENRRFSQKTAGNRSLGSVTSGPSPLARPYVRSQFSVDSQLRGSKCGWGGCPSTSTVLLLASLKDQHGKHEPNSTRTPSYRGSDGESVDILEHESRKLTLSYSTGEDFPSNLCWWEGFFPH